MVATFDTHPAVVSVEHLEEDVDPVLAELAELRAAVYRLTVLAHRHHDGELDACEDCSTYLELVERSRSCQGSSS